MAGHGPNISPSSWRYRVMKKYKHRAEYFYRKSNSEAEAMAWLQVIAWFDSILKNHRCITEHGAIGLEQDNTLIQDCGEVAEHGQRRST